MSPERTFSNWPQRVGHLLVVLPGAFIVVELASSSEWSPLILPLVLGLLAVYSWREFRAHRVVVARDEVAICRVLETTKIGVGELSGVTLEQAVTGFNSGHRQFPVLHAEDGSEVELRFLNSPMGDDDTDARRFVLAIQELLAAQKRQHP